MPLELLQCIVHEPPPMLSPKQFSAELVDFAAHCLQRDPSARPTPGDLQRHPFYMAYAQFEGGDPEMQAWVQQALARREAESK